MCWHLFDPAHNFLQTFQPAAGGMAGYTNTEVQSDVSGGYAGGVLTLPHSSGADRIEPGHLLEWWPNGTCVYAGIVAPDDNFGNAIIVYYNAAGTYSLVQDTASQARYGTFWRLVTDIDQTGTTAADATQVGNAIKAAYTVDGMMRPIGGIEDTGDVYNFNLLGVVRQWLKRCLAGKSIAGPQYTSVAILDLLQNDCEFDALLDTTAFSEVSGGAYLVSSTQAFDKTTVGDAINFYQKFDGWEYGGEVPKPGVSLNQKTAMFYRAPDLTTLHYIVEAANLKEWPRVGTGQIDITLTPSSKLRAMNGAQRDLYSIRPGQNFLITGLGDAPRTLSTTDSKTFLHSDTVKWTQAGEVTVTANKVYDPAVLLARLKGAAA